jgi:hypothetical protein
VQDQLLLAQQKVKKAEEVDQIKSAKDMAEPPVVDTEEAPAAPAPAASAPASKPAPAKPVEKVKVKTKTPAGSEKSKQKSGTLDW